jgi:hypothetical protein
MKKYKKKRRITNLTISEMENITGAVYRETAQHCRPQVQLTEGITETVAFKA